MVPLPGWAAEIFCGKNTDLAKLAIRNLLAMNKFHVPIKSGTIGLAGCYIIICLILMSQALASAGERIIREPLKGGVVADDESRSARGITQPGDYVRTVWHQGIKRSYRIHVPQGYSGERAAPLLVAFHGGGGDMDYMAEDKYYGLISKSDAESVVLVFPNGYSKFRSGKFATWNAGACCAKARDNEIDDVGFVRNMIRNVAAELNINRERIYAAGMSNGGMMAYRLACEMAATFKGIAAVAGTDNTLACTPSGPISILHIHALDDDRVLFNGGAGDKFRNESKVADFTSVAASIEKWVKLNKCNPTPQRVREKPGGYCEQYSPCAAKVTVQLCVTKTGGHSWPGGSKPRASEPPSRALSANDLIWEFFSL